MAYQHRFKRTDRQSKPTSTAISVLPCSLSSNPQNPSPNSSSNDTPIKLILNRSGGATKSPPCSKLDTAQRSTSSYDRLLDQNLRLRAQLSHYQTPKQPSSSSSAHRHKFKQLQQQLSRIDLSNTLSTLHENTRLNREVAALKTSNQELQQKVQDLTKSLTSCRQLLAEAEEKLDRKKELVRGKDEQLRRYLGVIQAMRRNQGKEEEGIQGRKENNKEGNNRENNKESQQQQKRREDSEKPQHRITHTNSASNMNRNQSAMDNRQLTTRNGKNKQQQLSRLWSGTISKTTRITKK